MFRRERRFDRSSLTLWRQRLGGERLAPAPAAPARVRETGALATKDLERVAVDTTVQPKAVAHPTDARMIHKAIEKLIALLPAAWDWAAAKPLRAAKRAMITAERYTHAHQFQRANREHKLLRSRLGRLIRDINRKIAGDPALSERLRAVARVGASKPALQNQRQRGPKIYSLHASEVECIEQGKARGHYEFGCKVPIATPVGQPKARQGPARQSL